jgi:capsular exopolysaccharide synthesis family protein
VTSTFSSEGKSFVSINLASSLAMTDKKVLLIGLDLRMPKLLDYIGEIANIGVTNYIINNNLNLNDIVLKSDKLIGVDIIPSGIIPPNPAELLMTDRMSNLMKEAKGIYDYIIVDTAPVGLVTDTLLIKDFADVTLYITRAGVLEKKSLSVLKDIYENKKLNNITALVNGIDLEAGYGYGYGKRYVYGGYVEDEIQVKNRFFNFFKKNN